MLNAHDEASSMGSTSTRRRNRDPYPLWYIAIEGYELLDSDDAPMVVTIKARGEITDYVTSGTAFKIAEKETRKSILSVIKRHCREHISCLKYNKIDPQHDYAKDNVDGGTRGNHLMKGTRALLRSLGRTVTHYELISLIPAPIRWSGSVKQWIDGSWVYRRLSIEPDSKMVLTTVELDGSEDAHWTCHYCLGINKGLEFACSQCGARRPKVKKNLSRKISQSSIIGDASTYKLGAKNICAVQEVEAFQGHNHVIVVTLNKLPNGTVLNSGAQHRGPNLIKSKHFSNDDATHRSRHDQGVTFTVTFSCHDENQQHELTAALRNSSSPILPTLWRAAQRLDLVTLRLLVERFHVDANRENAYGNTAILLAVRSILSSLEKKLNKEGMELEMGCRVVEYLLIHGADPYRRGANGQNSFEYLLTATSPADPVRKRLLRLLNQSRIRWEPSSEAVYLLRPIADPKQPERILLLKPGHADIIMEQTQRNHEVAFRKKQQRRKAKGFPVKSLDEDDEESEDGDEDYFDTNSSFKTTSLQGNLQVHGQEEEEEEEEIMYEVPENQCLKCKQLSLQLVQADALWVCPRCGNMEDWADAPLDVKVKKDWLPPEEVIYRRRIRGDGKGPVAWYGIDKTNLYLKLSKSKVDNARERLNTPDPSRLTGFKSTTIQLPHDTLGDEVPNEDGLLAVMRPVTAPHPHFKIVAVDAAPNDNTEKQVKWCVGESNPLFQELSNSSNSTDKPSGFELLFSGGSATAANKAARMRGVSTLKPHTAPETRPFSRISPSVFKNARKRRGTSRGQTPSIDTITRARTAGHQDNKHQVMSFAEKRNELKHASSLPSMSLSNPSKMGNILKKPPQIQTEIDMQSITSSMDEVSQSVSPWHPSKPSPVYTPNINASSSQHKGEDFTRMSHEWSPTKTSGKNRIPKPFQSTQGDTLQRAATTVSSNDATMPRRRTSFPSQDHKATPSPFFSVSGKMRAEYSFKHGGSRFATPHQSKTQQHRELKEELESETDLTSTRPKSRMTPRALSAMAAKQTVGGYKRGS